MEDKNASTSPPTEPQTIGRDQIRIWVRGDNNIIGKNINVINQEIKPTGLTLLEPDYFERRKNVKDDFENWKKGYEFELPSIYYGYEFKREAIISEINQKLETSYKILLLGESGTSKSTVMKEVMCDYFRNGYSVLHNIGRTELREPDDIVQYIESLVKGNNKLLVAIDNAHDKKMAAIYYVIEQLSFIESSTDLLFIITARIPEYDNLVSNRVRELDDHRDRIALKKFNEIPNIKYTMPYLKNAKEVELFFTFYETKHNLHKVTSKSYPKIFNETQGHPIMVKFFLLGTGLLDDIENRYSRYLFDSEAKKPIGENIHAMIICALFSISNHVITDEDLDYMKIKKYAKAIIGILRKREDGTWTTIHPRWDMELFSYLFSSEDEDEIDDRKKYLGNASTSILELHDKEFSLSVLSALYRMAGESRVPIKIVNDIVRIPDYISEDDDAMFLIHGYYKSDAYYDLKLYKDMLFESNEAIRINENDAIPLYNKGVALYNLGKIEEAIEWYDRALKMDPNDVDAFNNKGIALSNLGKDQEAVEWYDRALESDDDVNAYSNKGIALSNLGKDQEAIDCYDRALKMDPNNANTLSNKGISLNNLGKYEEAIDWYDKALAIDPNDISTLSNKGIALSKLGKYEEAIDWYDKALKIDSNDVSALSGKGLALYNLSKFEEAIEWCDKALKIDPNYFSAKYTKHIALEAIKWLRYSSEDVGALINKGIALGDRGKFEDEIDYHDKALEIDPTNVEALNNKGVALENLGKFEEAIECFDKVLEIEPYYVNVLSNKGYALFKLNKLDEAIQCFSNVIQLDSSYADAWYSRSFLLVKKGEINEALKDLEKAIRLDKTYRESVKTDKDFEGIRNDERFKKLIGD